MNNKHAFLIGIGAMMLYGYTKIVYTYGFFKGGLFAAKEVVEFIAEYKKEKKV